MPVRGGQFDVLALRTALERLKERFKDTEEVCLAPSLGMELRRVAVVASGFYRAPGEAIFERLCLVYPRAAKK